MQIRKLLLIIVLIFLIVGSINVAKCEIFEHKPKIFHITPGESESFPFPFNSSQIVYGNIISDVKRIEVKWTRDYNSVDWHNTDEIESNFNFSLTTEIKANYTLTIKNLDDIENATIKVVYFTQDLDENKFEKNPAIL